jgi:hypothetical protein
MDTPVLLRQANDGNVSITFHAAVLGAATTERPGAPRWTELTVYRLPLGDEVDQPRGGYVVSKVGRSTVAHLPSCKRARPRQMIPVSEVPEPGERVPCLACLPNVIALEPDTLLECTRCLVLQARTPADLAKVLMQGRPGDPIPPALTGIVEEIIRQVRLADPEFDNYCAASLAPTRGVNA